MNLRRVDLNLLVAFDALMRTRHVSRAASLVGVGQPAMSAALARLRHLFADDLLVRQHGGMAPTERALQLAPEIARILREVELVLEEPSGFNPADSRRLFRLRMSDLLTALLMPSLMDSLAKEAPGLRLEVTHLAPEVTVDALERGELDLAVSTGLDIPKSVQRDLLFDDRQVIVCGGGFGNVDALADIDSFSRLPQVRVSQSPLDDRFVDGRLAELGLERNVVLTLPHWLSAGEVLRRSGLIAVMPDSIARRVAEETGLRVLPLPLEDTGFSWHLYWHVRNSRDAAHIWLRDKIMETVPGGA
jgi:DNA-binding transcriptional LysR family regulator